MQNFTKTGQLAAELWQKNDFQYSGRPPYLQFKKNHIWLHDYYRIPNVLLHNKFHHNRMTFRGDMAIMGLYRTYHAHHFVLSFIF